MGELDDGEVGAASNYMLGEDSEAGDVRVSVPRFENAIRASAVPSKE